MPIEHFRYATAHALRMVDYMIDLGKRAEFYEKGFRRHQKGMSMLAFFQLVAAFERLLKELAALCVDEVAPLCTDDRLNRFSIRGADAAPHVRDQKVGRALCESQLWHDVNEVNLRFKDVLQLVKPNPSHKTQPEFKLFDENAKGSVRAERKSLLVIFQLRHTIAHNLGTLTRSDGGKLQRLVSRKLDSPKELDIDRLHVYYLQRFLSPLGEEINHLISDRLGLVLTEFHADAPTLIDHQGRATELSKLFRTSFTISGFTAHP